MTSDGLTVGTVGEELAIMFVGAGCCDNIQRIMAADDIAGIQALY